ncbi:alpha/beta fold hydrolase [Jongsikchunia kroppenstedtii]|uniref:alpha/beta fold hydrolase n=1 Tax=Jongsikchunia kroppenstedtii TaxID=1121721 RepID=UPI00037E30EE|nr:alpha/beta hydrolase [Jongsikchunia kroppenstedtii]
MIAEDHGGEGPPILLLHGLMGRGRTWRRQIPWLRSYGRVFTIDAAFHRGAGADQATGPDDIANERFVADIAEVLTVIDRGPAVLIGHSMGGLHAWCTAAEYPELVAAIVVEDMAPDFRGRTTGTWQPWFATWPDRFDGLAHAVEMFGPIAGEYFYDAFDDGRLHGELSVWADIAERWGERDFWEQWQQVRVPALLIEASGGVTPEGQMRTMAETNEFATLLTVEGGHLLHDDAPQIYRGAVEAFLDGLTVARPSGSALAGEGVAAGRGQLDETVGQ